MLREGVITVNGKKKFVEPKIVKYQESLDKVTLTPSNYNGRPDGLFKSNGVSNGHAYGHSKK